jgi:hypothetical protein
MFLGLYFRQPSPEGFLKNIDKNVILRTLGWFVQVYGNNPSRDRTSLGLLDDFHRRLPSHYFTADDKPQLVSFLQSLRDSVAAKKQPDAQKTKNLYRLIGQILQVTPPKYLTNVPVPEVDHIDPVATEFIFPLIETVALFAHTV